MTSPTDQEVREVVERLQNKTAGSGAAIDMLTRLLAQTRDLERVREQLAEVTAAWSAGRERIRALEKANATLRRRMQALESPRRVAAIAAPVTMDEVQKISNGWRLTGHAVLGLANKVVAARAAQFLGGEHDRP